MFGEFIVVSALTVTSALIQKGLEIKNKNKHATALDITTKTGLLIFAIKKVNDLFQDFTSL